MNIIKNTIRKKLKTALGYVQPIPSRKLSSFFHWARYRTAFWFSGASPYYFEKTNKRRSRWQKRKREKVGWSP